MSARAPELNRKLVLEGSARVPDGAGGFATTWTVLGTLWAAIKPGTGRETEVPGLSLATTRYRVLVRAAPYGAPSRPVPGQRFRDGERILEIIAVTDTDPQCRYLTCHATEEVAS